MPNAIFDWIEASHEVQGRPIKAVTGEALIDLVFGGRLSLRSIGDRLEEPRAFARAVGVRLVGAGLGSVLSSLTPGRRAAPHSPVARRLEALRADARGIPAGVDTDIDQEQTLLTVLGVSIWAAVLPWLAGGEPVFAGALSLIALGFPAVFLFTRRTGKAARKRQAVR